MASYFDLKPPRSKATAPSTAQFAKAPDKEAFGNTGLLSPQVTRILDDLELDDQSSDDEQASQSGDSSPSDNDAESSRRDKPDQHHLRKAQTSPLPQSGKKKVHVAAPSPRPGVGSAQKHPHLPRFHSLRSMLFQSNIEANMQKAKKSERNEETENQWKAEHEKRQGLNRSKTPESPSKEGFAHKIGNKLRRLTSKEVPTMKSIGEDVDNESTASDDDEDEQRRLAEDSEEINHSDIEDLVRWVSRRDPPSDGERRKPEINRREVGKEDSGQESLGHSDVEDLVRWISRNDKSQPTAADETKQRDLPHSEYSDASTQSDSEDEPMDEEDVDDLVRWVSRREGPNAGPIRDKKGGASLETSSEAHDKHTDDLVRCATRKDETSGESDVPVENTPHTVEENKPLKKVKHDSGSSLKTEVKGPPARESKAELTSDDINELVKWVSRKKPIQK